MSIVNMSSSSENSSPLSSLLPPTVSGRTFFLLFLLFLLIPPSPCCVPTLWTGSELQGTGSVCCCCCWRDHIRCLFKKEDGVFFNWAYRGDGTRFCRAGSASALPRLTWWGRLLGKMELLPVNKKKCNPRETRIISLNLLKPRNIKSFLIVEHWRWVLCCVIRRLCRSS